MTLMGAVKCPPTYTALVVLSQSNAFTGPFKPWSREDVVFDSYWYFAIFMVEAEPVIEKLPAMYKSNDPLVVGSMHADVMFPLMVDRISKVVFVLRDKMAP
jgi:hypothetical protein